ncbi:transmembrane protein 272 [Amia ocellicauda]|uniref:transmembrane protein 272 n=1 Tax=Amia ocellicauda TaxID=2972642 RepID=UPI0034642975
MDERRDLLQNIPKPPTLNTPSLVISKIITSAIPVAQIVIGVLYLHDCPRQRYIPIYLVVSGVFTVALSLLACLPCTKNEEEGGTGGLLGNVCTTWTSLASLFLFCWFITGNVWIYSIYQPNYTPGAADFCNKTLYLFAFWTTTLVYILLGVLLVGGCCALLCVCICGGNNSGILREDV